jgi:hypothetical protein
MRIVALFLTVLLTAFVAGCGTDGPKGKYKNEDRPQRRGPKG